MTLDSSCGLFGWRPRWMQMFKTPQWFAFVLFLVFFLKGSPNTYYLTLIDVILKRFGLNTEQFQWVISSGELGIIPIIIFFPLIKFIPKKPVCLMLAVWIMAIGLLLCTIPKIMKNETSSPPPHLEETQRDEYSFLLAGYFFYGLGSSIINALGIPFIDDNVPEEQSPAYVGCVLAGGLSAQFFAGLFGEFIKNGHGDKPVEIGVDIEDDVDWWAGFVLVASGMVFTSPFLAMFPNKLTEEDSYERKKGFTMESSLNYLVEYLKTLRRLMSNKVFMLSLLSHVFSLSAVLGFRNNFSVFQLFMFNKTSKEAKIGVVMAVTTLLSAFVMAAVGATIKYFRIKIRPLISWNILVCLVSIICSAILFSTGCDVPIIYKESNPLNLNLPCNTGCNSSLSLEFFCAEDKKHQFLSPCHAGCRGLPVNEGQDTFYLDCECAAEALAHDDTGGGKVVKGFCPGNCDGLYTFFISLVIILPSLWFSGPLGVSRFLITMRCIDEEDKEEGVMMLMAAGSLLAGFLSPPIFGSILDDSCKYRPEGTSCKLYDSEDMRKHFFLGLIIALSVVVVLELFIFIFGKDLELYSKIQKKKEEVVTD